MPTSLELTHFDLVTPDGTITDLKQNKDGTVTASVYFEEISPSFVGFDLDADLIFFNFKSTLAQLGMDAVGEEIHLDFPRRCAEATIRLVARDPLAEQLLPLIPLGAHIGKLFAADPRRRVRDPFYISRMFGRSDRFGDPLLSLGGLHGSGDLILDKVDGRTVAYLSLQNGRVAYADTIEGFLPTIAKSLTTDISLRELLKLHQEWQPYVPRNVTPGEILLVKTLPLHIRTVFARVVHELLSDGYQHTSACVLQPDTQASGDIYELFGDSKRELTDIPLEFYTLEPFREYVFFSDRDQLQTCIEDETALFNAFDTAPGPQDHRVAVYIAKGEQLLKLNENDWIERETHFHEFPGTLHSDRQAVMVERYLEQQPSYPFLKAINDGLITSQGILLSRYFPSPLMKRMLLSDHVQRCLYGIYFQYPSLHHQEFFSPEDQALLNDLNVFGIPVFWLDQSTKKILRYIQKPGTDAGMFVPNDKVDTYLKSTVFGIYGSNLTEGDFENEIRTLFQGVLEMRSEFKHTYLNPEKPLSLITGGGPGVMELGNRVAKELDILSCANIVDFRLDGESVVNEQIQNPYVEAKMTYRLRKLVERQAEFNLDFPIFLIGGIGTDFEFTLEEVRRKVGSTSATPCLLFGSSDYWEAKITSRFQCNVQTGTNKGSEWLSNCFYCVQNAAQGLQVYRDFFNDQLKIGKTGPAYNRGFVTIDDQGRYC